MSGYLTTIINAAHELVGDLLIAGAGEETVAHIHEAIRAVHEGRAFVGSGEICARFEISRTQLKRWRAEPEFPPPLAELAQGPVWDAGAVIAWHQERFRDR